MNLRHLSLFCLGTALLAAGEPKPWSWPKVIRIGIEEVKPGKEMAHQKNEFAWSQVLAEAKSPYHFLGMTPVAGGSQAWWAWGFSSFAEIGKANAFVDDNPALKAKTDPIWAKDGEFITNFNSTIYALRPDLSRGPGSIAPRFYWVFTIRVRPGHDPEFEAMCKRMNAIYDKAGLTARWGIYQAMAGATNPTFMVVVPMRSLADMDAMMADEEKFAKAAGEEGLKALSKLTADSTGREEAVVLGVDPKLSYPDAEDIAMDPDFWKVWAPKPAPKAKAEKAK
jgi:hypothetical protein